MMRLLRVPASRIDIVYPGVDHGRFRPPTSAELPCRPRVSDDNPFSEAQFKTLKYQP